MIILHLFELALLVSILVLVILIYRKENKTLAEIDDLKTSVAGLSGELHHFRRHRAASQPTDHRQLVFA